MAKLEGNIIGDPSGTLGNVVFGKARTVDGKVVTMRRWARPTNPKTAGQTMQRQDFANTVQVTRDLGPGFYRIDWNRAVGQLPGFHSLMGIFLYAWDALGELEGPPDTPLGTLHVPDTFTIEPGATNGLLAYTWSDEVGDNGAVDDDVICFAIRSLAATDTHYTVYIMTPELTRATSPGEIDVTEPNVDYVCGMYLRSTLGEPAGLSTCIWEAVTSGQT